ncbi:MAG: hypothetical protein EB060_11670, partial [Proteobacteria bacterium]|nr:hypothetical protein [Pseudomonadota bacterium]
MKCKNMEIDKVDLIDEETKVAFGRLISEAFVSYDGIGMNIEFEPHDGFDPQERACVGVIFSHGRIRLWFYDARGKGDPLIEVNLDPETGKWAVKESEQQSSDKD